MICCGIGVTRSAAKPADFFFRQVLQDSGAERRCPGKHSIWPSKCAC